MKTKVVIIDYAMGNVFSIEKRLKKMNCEVVVSSEKEAIQAADKLILPGVGHFAKAMEMLHSLDLVSVLNEEVLQKKKPILGICLGMQLLAKSSEEGNASGLGWIDGTVKRFSITDTIRHKVPHTGWNAVEPQKDSVLLTDMPASNEFYFVHSYYFSCNDASDVWLSTNHELDFTSAVQKNNIFGVQFHPEKSHETGFKLLQNFIAY